MKRKDIISVNINILLGLRYFIILLILQSNYSATGQLNLHFNDGNINIVPWQGNINNFIINTAGQLQLKAAAAGESSVFTKYKVPADSLQVDLYFKLQFAPSNDNFSKIYLFTDNLNESVANGYYLRLGENGANDAIQVWKLQSGMPQLLGSGTMGAIGVDPAQARLRFKIYRDGLWIMTSDYDGNTVFEEDLIFSAPDFVLPDSMYFGIYCKYTSTRSDKFFYDDISIKTVEKDTLAPFVVNTEVINENRLKLIFSETLEGTSAANPDNYEINNGLGKPDNVTYNASRPLEVVLHFTSNEIKSGINYILTIRNIKDKSNNSLLQQVGFVFASKPSKGDLILTEVLTDPYIGGEDFIEIYNKSEKFIKLDSLIIRNNQRNENRAIRTDRVLLPAEYLAVSRNVKFLQESYSPPGNANFIEATIPALNVADANISIISVSNGVSISLDSFDYREDMHFSLIDETKGVSLERINLNGTTNDANNWHSASALAKYATPGYKNSSFTNVSTGSNNVMSPDKKVFSPNGDGFEDFVLLHYSLEKPGYLATLKIFDSEGFPVYELANNLLLGTDGIIKWDGINAEGNIAKLGMYIIHSRLFHTDGDILESKSVVVVAQNF